MKVGSSVAAFLQRTWTGAGRFFPEAGGPEFADGYRSPLWLVWEKTGEQNLIHKHTGRTLPVLGAAIRAGKVRVLPGIDFFDTWRLEPSLSVEADVSPGYSPSPPAPEENEAAQFDTKAAGEVSTVDSCCDVASQSSTSPWCPPKPKCSDEPTEEELLAAADKIQTMVQAAKEADRAKAKGFFLQPRTLGGLPHIWLQARLTVPLMSMRSATRRW